MFLNCYIYLFFLYRPAFHYFHEFVCIVSAIYIGRHATRTAIYGPLEDSTHAQRQSITLLSYVFFFFFLFFKKFFFYFFFFLLRQNITFLSYVFFFFFL